MCGLLSLQVTASPKWSLEPFWGGELILLIGTLRPASSWIQISIWAEAVSAEVASGSSLPTLCSLVRMAHSKVTLMIKSVGFEVRSVALIIGVATPAATS